MTKEVLVVITGVRIMDGQQEEVETTAAGCYYKKNGKHFILYDEVMEDGKGVIRNTVKISADSMEIIRKGAVTVHMLFQQGKGNDTPYQTPVGELMIRLYTKRFQLNEAETLIEAEVEYSLEINGEHMSDCCIKAAVRPI